MAADITGHDNGISRFCQFTADSDPFLNLTHSGGGDEYSVYLTFSGYFCITGHDMYTGFFCRFFHCSGNFFQFFHRKSFFDDKGAGQVQWFCSHACKIIDRTADGQFSDISTREKCWRYDKSIGRYSHSSCRRNQHCRIICCQIGICKMCLKHLIN